MLPGLMQFTRTPSVTPRSASALVRFMSAALTEPPTVKSALATRPPTPAMLTTAPLVLFRCGQAARVRRTAPKSFSA